jgi:hypothetical protein
MKCVVILICALVLLLDLGDHAFIGKARFVLPHSSTESLETSSHQYESLEPIGDYEQRRLGCHPTVRQTSIKASLPIVRHFRKITISFHAAGAGGLPG